MNRPRKIRKRGSPNESEVARGKREVSRDRLGRARRARVPAGLGRGWACDAVIGAAGNQSAARRQEDSLRMEALGGLWEGALVV